jgi:hypothetical protein
MGVPGSKDNKETKDLRRRGPRASKALRDSRGPKARRASKVHKVTKDSKAHPRPGFKEPKDSKGHKEIKVFLLPTVLVLREALAVRSSQPL